MIPICFFEDKKTRTSLLPFTFLRSPADIRVGILTIRQKWEARLQMSDSFTLTEPYLQPLYREITDPLREYYFIESAVLPDDALLEKILTLRAGECLTLNKKILVFFGSLSDFKKNKFSEIPFSGSVSSISHLWHIFQKNGEELEKDFQILTQNRKSAPLSASNRIIGNPQHIFAEEGVVAECCILNTTHGKIYLGRNVHLMEGSIVRGPFAACENAEIKMGAKIYGPTTLGPSCKAGGELNNVVMFGYSNKGHDGFLGNSVVGEWCNLGADTNCSNLKNTYDHVKIFSYETKNYVDTGLQFCGLFLGDHVKCSINSMFNTGTVVGIGCNIFGTGFPPKHIPSFSWGGSNGFEKFQWNKLLESIRNTMARREKEPNEALINALRELYHHHTS